jgi:hypothetical protein
MQLPLHILQLGEDRVARKVRTRDISTGGVCFLSDDRVEVGGRVEYLITLSDATPPVRIRCLGKVLRSLRRAEPAVENFETAVTMERYQFVRPDEVSDSISVSA